MFSLPFLPIILHIYLISVLDTNPHMQEAPPHPPHPCKVSAPSLMAVFRESQGPPDSSAGFQALSPSMCSAPLLTPGLQLAYKSAEQSDDQQAEKAPRHQDQEKESADQQKGGWVTAWI